VSCLHTHESAPYVLGALSPAERAGYQQHLASCSTCRAEVSDLAVLPGLLGRLDAAAAEATGAPVSRADAARHSARTGNEASRPSGTSQDSLPALLTAARRRRSREATRRRWQSVGVSLVAAALAVVATIGVRGMLPGSSGSTGPSANLVAMHGTGSPWPLHAEIALRAVGDRTEIRMHCHYDPAREPGSERYTFRLFSVSKSGAAQEVSAWSASFGDDMTFMTTADVRTADIGRVELRKDDATSVILAYDVA
jgi:hypothetical protein